MLLQTRLKEKLLVAEQTNERFVRVGQFDFGMLRVEMGVVVDLLEEAFIAILTGELGVVCKWPIVTTLFR